MAHFTFCLFRSRCFFIARQHSMHAECDIVLPILSVCLSVCLPNAGTVSKRMDTSSHFSDVHRSGFVSITATKNSKETPFVGALNVRGRIFFCKYCLLSRKRYEIGQLLLRNTNRKPGRSMNVGSNDLEWPCKALREGWKFYGRMQNLILRSNGLA